MRTVLFLFGQLSDDDLEWMLKAGRKRSLQEGDVLIRQGVPVDEVFILLEGRLAAWLTLRKGPEREIARLQAGEIVGEMSFVDARPPSATVKAVENSTVFEGGPERQARRRPRLRRPFLPRPRHLPLHHGPRAPPSARLRERGKPGGDGG
jgi:CRP-like cAMP-binding protein